MVSSHTILPYDTRLVLALATMIGLSVLILGICSLFLGLVWIAVYGISILIAHTSSIQLLLMLVVGYEMFRLFQHIKRKRYSL